MEVSVNQNRNFIDELLLEAEEKEEMRTLAYYDLLIIEIGKLEGEIASHISEADKEAQIIKEWALSKSAKLQERIDLLKLKLESFIREEEKKTIDLPHGTLKIRKKPNKVEISDVDLFLSKATGDLVKVIPESVKPNLIKIKTWMKMTRKIPEGVTIIEGKEEFTLKLKHGGNNDTTS